MAYKKTPISKWISLILALAAIILPKCLAAPTGLPDAGFQVLGVLIGAIVLFLTWGTGWTSMAVIAALMTLPGVTPAQVTQATFGNSTVVFLLICFMLAACLTKSGAAQRIAIWFLTNSYSRKSPWRTVAMYFAAVFVLNLFLSSATCIMILMPILLCIFDSVGLERDRHGALASMLLLCTVVISQLANGANPISHAVTMQGFSMYESYTGEAMDFFRYCLICTPIAIVCIAAVYLVVRFVWRPDVRPLSSIDYDALAAAQPAMTKRERISIIFYLICVLFWLLPGLFKFVWPAAGAVLGTVGNCIPPIIALILMNFIKVDGEKVLDWSDAVKAINVPTYIFIATIIGLGSFMGNPDVGLSEWLSASLAPLFSGISPFVFLLIMVLLVNVLTNFCSNSVALSVVFAIAMPLSMTIYQGAMQPMLLAMLVTSSAQNGWATSPATPTAAVAYASGWGSSGTILRWGLLMMIVQVIICLGLGIPLSNLIL